jgi:hypothetical protein
VGRIDGFAFDEGGKYPKVSFQFFSDLLGSDSERGDTGTSTFSAAFGEIVLSFADMAESDEFAI